MLVCRLSFWVEVQEKQADLWWGRPAWADVSFPSFFLPRLGARAWPFFSLESSEYLVSPRGRRLVPSFFPSLPLTKGGLDDKSPCTNKGRWSKEATTSLLQKNDDIDQRSPHPGSPWPFLSPLSPGRGGFFGRSGGGEGRHEMSPPSESAFLRKRETPFPTASRESIQKERG